MKSKKLRVLYHSKNKDCRKSSGLNTHKGVISCTTDLKRGRKVRWFTLHTLKLSLMPIFLTLSAYLVM